MGNNCCDARKKPTVEESKTKQRNKKNHNKQRKKRNRRTMEWKGLLGNYFINKGMDCQNKSSSDSSEESYSIDYELSSARRMTILQRTSILKVLERFQCLRNNQDEQFDSYSEGVYHTETGEVLCTIALSSHAFYVLDREDFAMVKRRAPVLSLTGLLIDAGMTGVLLTVADDENVLISSGETKDIVKCLQEIHIEANNNFIPWKVESSFSIVKAIASQNKDLSFNIDALFDKNLYFRLLQKGKLTEKILGFHKAINGVGDFLITNLAVYRVLKKCKLDAEMKLSDVNQIQVDRELKLVSAKSQENSITWNVPLEYADRIKKAAALVNNCDVFVSNLQ